MNFKHFYLFFFILLSYLSTATQAAIFQCKASNGKTIFTDNPRKCADSNAQKEISLKTTEISYDFHQEIPDLLQTQRGTGFAGKGEQYCAPVAASNALVWLEKNSDARYQIALVNKLAAPDFMNTNTVNGTNIFGFTQGIDKYAKAGWGGYKRLEYSGWSDAPAKFRSKLKKPTLQWMLSALHQKGAVWINIGWYKKEQENYRRVGGHFVTLVGYARGKLIIHDPSPRAGLEPSSQFVEFSTLTSGKLLRGTRSSEAQNHFALGEGMRISKKADLGIIDGAVILELD